MLNNKEATLWKADDILLVKLNYTDFDENTSQEFKKYFDSLVLKYTSEAIILDLSDVSLMDGAGVATIINLWTITSKKNIKLSLCSAQNNVKQLLEQKKIQSIMELYNSSQQALQVTRQLINLEKQMEGRTKSLENFFGLTTTGSYCKISPVTEMNNKIDSLQSAS